MVPGVVGQPGAEGIFRHCFCLYCFCHRHFCGADLYGADSVHALPEFRIQFSTWSRCLSQFSSSSWYLTCTSLLGILSLHPFAEAYIQEQHFCMDPGLPTLLASEAMPRQNSRTASSSLAVRCRSAELSNSLQRLVSCTFTSRSSLPRSISSTLMLSP